MRGGGSDIVTYAIETLKIEKYKLIALRRQLMIMQSEAQTSLSNEINNVCDKLKQLDWAIAELKRLKKGLNNYGKKMQV